MSSMAKWLSDWLTVALPACFASQPCLILWLYLFPVWRLHAQSVEISRCRPSIWLSVCPSVFVYFPEGQIKRKKTGEKKKTAVMANSKELKDSRVKYQFVLVEIRECHWRICLILFHFISLRYEMCLLSVRMGICVCVRVCVLACV